MTNAPETTDTRWHLDRKVPLAMVLAMLLQTGGAVWWAATMESRAGTIERDLVRMQAEQQRDRDDVRNSVNALRYWMEGRFDRIEGKLDRKVDKP